MKHHLKAHRHHDMDIRPKLGVTRSKPDQSLAFCDNRANICDSNLTIAERLAVLDPCLLFRHHLCVVIELRPNALASPRTARLTNDIHP
jgi:hypothetical protein